MDSGGNQGLWGWFRDAFGFGGEQPPIKPIEGETNYNTHAFVLSPESKSALEIFQDAIEQGKDEAAEGALEIGDRALKEVAPDLIPGGGALAVVLKNSDKVRDARNILRNAKRGKPAGRALTKARDFLYGKRYAYMGKTPGKSSDIGKEVIEKMRANDKVRTVRGGKTIFQASDGEWYDIKQADMAHGKAAVEFWNETGRFAGPWSDTVKKWMNNSEHYYLELNSINRSEGAKLGKQYLDPVW